MKKYNGIFTVIVGALLLTGNVLSQSIDSAAKDDPADSKDSHSVLLEAKAKPTPGPVLSVLFEHCLAGDTVCESGNRVRNDVAGKAYVNGSEGVSVAFFAGGSRDLVFRLDGSNTRTLRLDLRDVAYAGGVPSWWYTAPQQNTKPQMNVLGAYYAKEQCGSAATCNENFETRINAGYWKAAGVNNTTYAMLWNPTARADRPVNSPLVTSAVNVNYIKDATGERFIITPLPSADCPVGTACNANPYIAGLEATSGRTVSGAGQYVMPFTMTVRIQ